MTKEDTERFIALFKEAVIKQATDSVASYGSIPPIMTFAVINDEGQPGFAPLMLPDSEWTPADREQFFQHSIKAVFDEFEQLGLTPLCFSFATEAWTVAKLREDQTVDELLHGVDVSKEKTKRETLWISFQEPGRDSTQMYEMKRQGTQHVAPDGVLVDTVELHEIINHTTAGRLVGRAGNVFRHYQP